MAKKQHIGRILGSIIMKHNRTKMEKNKSLKHRLQDLRTLDEDKKWVKYKLIM